MEDEKQKQIQELRIVIQLFLDAIDGDVRATQWFDARLIAQAKEALKNSKQKESRDG